MLRKWKVEEQITKEECKQDTQRDNPESNTLVYAQTFKRWGRFSYASSERKDMEVVGPLPSRDGGILTPMFSIDFDSAFFQ